MRTVTLLVAVLATLLLSAGPVLAVVPPNDDAGGAIPVNVGTTVSQSTADATANATDDLADCGGLGATVWFTFTNGPDAMVVSANSFESDYFAVILVAEGSAGGPVTTFCDSVVEFEAQPNTTYYFMVGACCDSSATGGSLVFKVTEAPQLGISFDSVSRINPRTGVVTATGSLSCSPDFDFVHVDVAITQRVGRFNVIHGFNHDDFSCTEADGGAWTLQIRGDDGKFEPGSAEIEVFAFGCSENGCTEAEARGTTRMRR